MPKNKNFFLRIIKLNALFNTGRKYTIDELIESVSDYLYEKTGNKRGISARSLRADIKFMREEFNAPIIGKNKRYYYRDNDFSIFNGINETDAELLLEASDVLKRNIPLPFVEWFVKMTDKAVEKSGLHTKYMFFPYVILDSNPYFTGLQWIDKIYEAIEENRKIIIDYDSFDGQGDFEDMVRPYLLREYQNRWFLIGKPENEPEPFFTIPLDRIVSLKHTKKVFNGEEKQKIISMFDEIIGVTYIKENPVEQIELEFKEPAVGYVLTKPIHHTQRILMHRNGRLVIELKVRTNYELLQSILHYVPNVKVHKPKYLREKMIQMLSGGLNFMQEE